MPSGIQNNNTIQVDVVYTKLGRYYKSIGSVNAQPVKFALSDDGIDYSLYDSNLPLTERGIRLERTPVFDGRTDETSLLRYKLLTLPRTTTEVSTMELSTNQVAFNVRGLQVEQIIRTVNINVGFSSTNGFLVRLRDTKYLYVNELPSFDINQTTVIADPNNLVPQQIRLNGSAQIPSTFSFDIVYDATRSRFTSSTAYRTKCTIESLDSGYSKEIDIVVNLQ